MNLLSYVLAFGAGVISPAQAGANSALNKGISSPLWAAVFVYLSGLAGVLFIQLIVRQAWPGSAWSGLPWWVWTGGVISIATTLTGLLFAKQMGSGMYTGLTLTASLISSMVLDQFGLFGFDPHPISALRVGGAAFLIAGIWMIAKS